MGTQRHKRISESCTPKGEAFSAITPTQLLVFGRQLTKAKRMQSVISASSSKRGAMVLRAVMPRRCAGTVRRQNKEMPGHNRKLADYILKAGACRKTKTRPAAGGKWRPPGATKKPRPH